jgi:hypothetical protein
MWTSIIEFLLPIATWIFGKYVESDKASKDARAAYVKFLETMQSSASTPATMRNSYQDQIRRLREGSNGVQ